MSKYEPLWRHVKTQGKASLLLSFAEIEAILGFKIDHSFLNFKKELIQLGYQVKKVSLKEKTVIFIKY